MDSKILEVLQDWCGKNPDCGDYNKAWGKCLVSSIDLATLLDEYAVVEFIRVTGNEYTGREHWALLLDDEFVVDATARQFRATDPFPIVKPLFDWLDDCCEWLVDGVDYAVFSSHLDDEPRMIETWIREDILPGEMLMLV